MLDLVLQQPEWLPLEQSLELGLQEPQRTQVLGMIEDNRELMQSTRGSTNNHQAWPGGWWDHYAEGMNLSRVLYPIFQSLRPLSFSLHDAMMGFYAHDIEKPWKYDFRDGEWHHKPNFATKKDANDFRHSKLAEYDIELTPLQANAMQYAEGELGELYSNRERRSSELASFVHTLDHTSARLWHSFPSEQSDPWSGAFRVKNLKR